MESVETLTLDQPYSDALVEGDPVFAHFIELADFFLRVARRRTDAWVVQAIVKVSVVRNHEVVPVGLTLENMKFH